MKKLDQDNKSVWVMVMEHDWGTNTGDAVPGPDSEFLAAFPHLPEREEIEAVLTIKTDFSKKVIRACFDEIIPDLIKTGSGEYYGSWKAIVVRECELIPNGDAKHTAEFKSIIEGQE